MVIGNGQLCHSHNYEYACLAWYTIQCSLVGTAMASSDSAIPSSDSGISVGESISRPAAEDDRGQYVPSIGKPVPLGNHKKTNPTFEVGDPDHEETQATSTTEDSPIPTTPVESATPKDQQLSSLTTGRTSATENAHQSLSLKSQNEVVSKQKDTYLHGFFRLLQQKGYSPTQLVSEMTHLGVQYLESELTGCQDTIKQLEKDLESAKLEKQEAEQELEQTREHYKDVLDREEKEIKELNEQVESYKSRIASLENCLRNLRKGKKEAEEKATEEKLLKCKEEKKVLEEQLKTKEVEKERDELKAEMIMQKLQFALLKKDVRLETVKSSIEKKQMKAEIVELRKELEETKLRAELIASQQREAEERSKLLKVENEVFVRFLDFEADFRKMRLTGNNNNH